MGHSNLIVEIRKEGTLLKSIQKMSGTGRKKCYKCGRTVSAERMYSSYGGEGPTKHPLNRFICQDCAPTKKAASDIMLRDFFQMDGLSSQKRPAASKRRNIQ